MRKLGGPLPGLLRERVMDPIGASNSWSWNGYSTSWEKLSNGVWAQGVSGGGHWGGGLFISSRDHARFGLLMSRDGIWENKRLIPNGWISYATTPCKLHHQYGFMWWLNTEGERGKMFPSAPSTSFFAKGAGGNVIWIDPVLDLVVVVRW